MVIEKNKAVFFDLDGTLTTEKSTWQFIHKKLGTTSKAKVNKDLFYKGKINYSKWGILDALLWKNTKIEKMKGILQSIPIVKDAEKTLSELNNRGFYNVIITSSLSLFTDILSKELGIDRCVANILECRGGCVTGNVEMIVRDQNKGIHVKKICKELNIQPEFCVAVGDSRFDVDMFEIVGFSIAFNPSDPLIEEKSDSVVKSDTLMDILPKIDKWLSNKTIYFHQKTLDS